MCAMMNFLQEKNRASVSSADVWEQYVNAHLSSGREVYYQRTPMTNVQELASSVTWQSPITSGMPENDRARVDLYPCESGWSGAPTVFLLHALMSASDTGYRRWARRFHEHGWNVAFLHLPYHYSRKPKGFLNGELAITADLVRSSEGLRQAVMELRQLMDWLRGKGSKQFGLWATSYGAWIAALLASVERGFEFITLITPIVNVDHTIWKSSASASMRRHLRRAGITDAMVAAQYPLSSPFFGAPLDPAERVSFVVGKHDRLIAKEDVHELHLRWTDSRHVEVAQGHFGFAAANEAFRLIQPALRTHCAFLKNATANALMIS